MDLISKLSKLLNIDKDELINKLNIEKQFEDITNKDIAQALGFYAVFENKEKIESFLNNKLHNKNKEIKELKNQIEEFNLLNEANENQSTFINDLQREIFKLKGLVYDEEKAEQLKEFKTFEAFNNVTTELEKTLKTGINEETSKVVPASEISNYGNLTDTPQNIEIYGGAARRIK